MQVFIFETTDSPDSCVEQKTLKKSHSVKLFPRRSTELRASENGKHFNLMKSFAAVVMCSLIFHFPYPQLSAMPTEYRTTPIIRSARSGKDLYEQNCSKCHGYDGTKGKFGAKNLRNSVLTDEQSVMIIQKGKGIMPSWEKKLTSEQIHAIISYIKTWRK